MSMGIHRGVNGLEGAHMSPNKVAVDWEKVAKHIGSIPRLASYENYSWTFDYAARAISDSTPRENDMYDADIRLSNAEVWIQSAYARGIQEGERREKSRWVKRIIKLFELPGVKP